MAQTARKVVEQESQPPERTDVLGELRAQGIRLVLNGDNLRLLADKQLSPKLKEEIKRAKPELLIILKAEKFERSKVLGEKLTQWTDAASEEKGFTWNLENWLTSQEHDAFELVCAMYLNSEIELRDVHQAFLVYARSHVRTRQVRTLRGSPMARYQNKEVRVEYVIKALENDGLRTQMVTSVAPQWEPTRTLLSELCRRFDITEEQYTESKR